MLCLFVLHSATSSSGCQSITEYGNRETDCVMLYVLHEMHRNNWPKGTKEGDF